MWSNVRLLSTSLLMVILITPASADDIPPCAVPNGASVKSWQTEMPSALLQAVHARVGELVAPGERFDATDVVRTGRDRRVIFIWNAGTRWIVATEHGGRGYNDPIFAYDLSQDGQIATLMDERIAFPNSVCSTASSLLGVKPRQR